MLCESLFQDISRMQLSADQQEKCLFQDTRLILLTVPRGLLHAPCQHEMVEQPVFQRWWAKAWCYNHNGKRIPFHTGLSLASSATRNNFFQNPRPLKLCATFCLFQGIASYLGLLFPKHHSTSGLLHCNQAKAFSKATGMRFFQNPQAFPKFCVCACAFCLFQGMAKAFSKAQCHLFAIQCLGNQIT